MKCIDCGIETNGWYNRCLKCHDKSEDSKYAKGGTN